MKVTIRRLTRHLDPDARRFIRQQNPYQRGGPDQIEVPVAVESHDFETTLEEVPSLIDVGRISPSDLINDGSGWMSVSDHPLLDLTEEQGDAGNSLLPFIRSSGMSTWFANQALAAGVPILVLVLVSLWLMLKG